MNSNDKIKALRKERKAQAVARFGGCCLKCGCKFKYMSMATFHHIDNVNREKKGNLAHLWTCSEEKREEELSNCILLCKNCHEILHEIKGDYVTYVDTFDFIFNVEL